MDGESRAGGADRSVDPRSHWCAWCGGALTQPPGPGRPRRYCKQSCRQAAHVARKLGAAAGLGEHQVIVARDEYESLLGRVAALRAAVADLERVRPAGDDLVDLRQSLDWLLSFARQI